jgi:diguanylate cyclase (GGDEF)-like protein
MSLNYEGEPLLARESLFRQKLNRLRRAGETEKTEINSRYSGFKTIEQTHYLNNAQNSLQHTDPRHLESLALLDIHTELYNHDTLSRVLKDETRRAQRYKKALTLLAISIDNLPSIIDHIEVTVFETLQKSMAQFLMKAVRDVDILGRYDLERFMIVCPETNLDGAIVLCGRLCKKLETEDFAIGGQLSRLTVSIGLATFPDIADSHDRLVSLAIQSLKAAKQAGGNTFKIVT